MPCAAYVSVINDLTDREDDFAAGKPNRLGGRSRAASSMLLAVTIVPGLWFAWWWRRDPVLLCAYLGAWAAFTLYSLPPFRFKTRGILGVLCDASGALVFPITVAVIVIHRAAHRPVSALWLASLALWGLAYGVRAILWHQLHDLESDRAAGAGTFAQRHPRAPRVLGRSVAFPLEMTALVAVLVQLRSGWIVAAVAVYAMLALQYVRSWGMRPLIVVPSPRAFMLPHEFYIVFFPLALLVAASARHGADVLVLIAHFIVFPAAILETARASFILLLPLFVRRSLGVARRATTPRRRTRS